MPLVAVVMVNWNTAKVTLQCMESVLDSDYPAFRVIVVDNGSRPEELELLKNGLPEYVNLLSSGKNHGYVGGVNRGLGEAEKLSPEYFLIMNNDTVIDAAAISELVAASKRHQDNCIVTGIVYDYNEPDLVQQVGSHFADRRKLIFKPYCSNTKDPGFGGEDIVMDMIDDVFWLLHRDVYEQVGNYCNYFWFNDEQADYALRAVEKGFKLVFTPKAKLWHMGSLSIGGRKDNPIREYFDQKSRLIFRIRHMNKKDFIACYLQTGVGLLVSLLKNCTRNLVGKKASWQLLLARVLGFLDFNRWLVFRKPDIGRIPRLLEKGENAISVV
jgi:GT2 family glycosyltransferase